ncbi:GNAT family N-acetyltransferase [Azospirillum thermophilum]|uniref:N-acetyltransferase n=1 Tax=Azospirillum thermophilum TaxID=2202148 RepID=A0A2S2CRJ8_9PROT|nr:GNAT family N-acetyltransferase [Azospirillum thermophilum]AWK87112.1 N-acetyltransferase [Azospirillum thermophilum]
MLTVERADSLPAGEEVAGCDFSFAVTCEARPPFDGPGLGPVAAIPPYRKSYGFDPEEITGGVTDGGLLAVLRRDGRFGGYLLASVAWNGYGLIEDLAVDRSLRGQGAGRLLMDEAVRWAREQGLPGLRLETQSNNVPACRFYQRYGFVLGGFDRHLYGPPRPGGGETALYWYLFLRQG